jgi:hypothetical protein
MWWLDVETGNNWSTDTTSNAQVIAGALAAVRAAGGSPAVYSTARQWAQIAGDYAPGVPAWYATGAALGSPQPWCGTSFTGGPVVLVQGGSGSFDGDAAC